MGTLHIEGIRKVQISNAHYQLHFVVVQRKNSQEEVSCTRCKKGTPLKFWGISKEKIVFECIVCKEEIILNPSKKENTVLEGILEQELKNWSGTA